MRVVDGGSAAGTGVVGEGRLASRSRCLEEDVTPIEVFRRSETKEDFRAFWSHRDRTMTLVGLGVAVAITVGMGVAAAGAADCCCWPPVAGCCCCC